VALTVHHGQGEIHSQLVPNGHYADTVLPMRTRGMFGRGGGGEEEEEEESTMMQSVGSC